MMSPSAEPSRVAVGAGRVHDTRMADVETAGEGYAARFAGPVGAWLLEVQATRALALVGAVASGPLSVLEVGGGHGQLTDPLLAAGHRVVVHGSRAVCHRRLGPRADRVGRVASDLWRLPFGDRCFDLVAGIRLLAHVEAWRSACLALPRPYRLPGAKGAEPAGRIPGPANQAGCYSGRSGG